MPNTEPPIYILTRFAQLYAPDVAPPPSDNWLRERIELLKKYTLPSIQGQIDQNFTWLLLVSDQVSTKWVDELEGLVRPRGTVVVQEGYASEGESFRRFLESRSESIITVWFDSDDMLHPEFISRLRAADIQVGEVLSFVKGAVHEPSTSRSAVYKNHGNPFLSLHDSSSNNVFLIGGHSKVSSESSKRLHTIMTKDPMWLQIIHGGNIANWFKNYARPVNSDYISRVFRAPVLEGHRPLLLQLNDWAKFAIRIVDRVFGRYIRRIKLKLNSQVSTRARKPLTAASPGAAPEINLPKLTSSDDHKPE